MPILDLNTAPPIHHPVLFIIQRILLTNDKNEIFQILFHFTFNGIELGAQGLARLGLCISPTLKYRTPQLL